MSNATVAASNSTPDDRLALRRSGSWLILFSLLCLLIGLAGCSALDKLRGKDFRGDEETKTKFRPESDGELFFFDKRSRQVERNLGV